MVMLSVLMGRGSRIMEAVGFIVTLGGCPSRFEKCIFQLLTRSSGLLAFIRPLLQATSYTLLKLVGFRVGWNDYSILAAQDLRK